MLGEIGEPKGGEPHAHDPLEQVAALAFVGQPGLLPLDHKKAAHTTKVAAWPSTEARARARHAPGQHPDHQVIQKHIGEKAHDHGHHGGDSAGPCCG